VNAHVCRYVYGQPNGQKVLVGVCRCGKKQKSIASLEGRALFSRVNEQ